MNKSTTDLPFMLRSNRLLICILQLSLLNTYLGIESAGIRTDAASTAELQQQSSHDNSLPSLTLSSSSSGRNSAISSLQVYWSKELDSEQSKSSIFSSRDGQDFSTKVHSAIVVKLENGCGRPKNLLATLSDGTMVCCRYREYQLRELRGDLYSYHLSSYLGMWNAPPTVIVSVNFSSKQWAPVAERAREEGWKDGSIVAMSLFVKGLTDVYIPPLLRDIMHKNETITVGGLSSAGLLPGQQRELVQWSDMAVFDFIIGHSDRMFNMLYNYQWNKNMMEKKVHNLLKTSGGQLLLVDNESGFWMGYAMGAKDPLRYALQEQLLSKFCIFRKSTAKKVESLTLGGSKPATKLEEYIKRVDSQSFKLIQPLDPTQRNEFDTRVSISLELIEDCAK